MPLPDPSVYQSAYGQPAWTAPVRAGSSFMKAMKEAQDAEAMKAMQAQQLDRQARQDQLAESQLVNKDYQFEREMALKEKELAARRAEKNDARNVAKRPGETTVRNLSEGQLLPGELTKVEQILKNNAGQFGPVVGRLGAMNPYDSGSQAINSQVKATAQLIGKYMEGGVLRAEDVPKYAAMLPGLSDTPDVAQSKIKNVRSLLSRKYNTDLKSLAEAGYDVSRFQPMQEDVPAQAAPEAAAPKVPGVRSITRVK